MVPEVEPSGAAELRTATEEAVAAAFCELLGLPKADRNDSFFARGGHSLLAARLLARLRRDLGVELPLRRVFETPTVADLAAAIDELGGAVAVPYEAIPRGLAPAGPAPASFGQARMWFLDGLLPDRASQNLPVSLRLRGSLDVGAFERAAVALEARHEGLRTVFVAGPTGPLQVQRPPGSVVLERVDLTDLPAGEREARAQEIVQAAAQVPFDLATGPLVRWLLVRTGPEVHRLAVVMHHIVADGWSIDLLIRDLAQLYGAERGGQTLELPPLPLRYADFAVWQRAWFASPAARQDEDYWRTALAGVPARLPLPTDRPRPTQARGRGRTIVGELPAETTAELDRRATAWGATPFLVLLAAYGAVLGRLAGEDDLVVGTPVAGRTRSELDGIVGLFLNTLPLRARVDLEGSFADHLARLTGSTLDAFAHQNLPFERLLEVLEVPRSLAHAPLFQVFLVLQNLPTGERPAADLTIEPVPLAGVSAPFDLTLAAAPAGDRLTLAWTFDTDLFDDVTIERLAARFTALLTAALAAPERRLVDLPWLLPGEEAELRRFGLESRAVGTRVVAPAATTLHGLVVAQAARDGAAPALAGRTLAGEWEELDYAELVHRAQALAHRLVATGLVPEERVVVCLPKSVEMLVAVLAVLGAGGAYVPLDPAWPAERKRFVLTDAGVRTVITSLAGADDWGAARVVTPDWTLEELAGEFPAVDPGQAAYVIYTSGSTGQPKGVVVEHRAAVAYVTAEAAALGHGPGDRCLQFASLAFDASVDEIFDSLASGATLVLLDDEGFGSGHEFFGFLARHRVTVAGVPTAYWHVLAQGFPAAPPDLRLLSFGGERALASAYAAWRAWLPATVRLANAYGPTEAVIAATRWEAGGNGTVGDPPIGRPVGDVRAYVLDATGRPVPPGLPGELCLGGEGLARGYLGLPAATADRFRPDPWAATPGGRYYRTGDAVRWTPEGELQYRGRLDFQVKLRGFRIELDEIAVALERHPAVTAATVVVDGAGNGEEGRLVAYVASSAPPSVAELHAFVAERLPAYMVPALVVPLPALPLTPSGKVDRAALPAPELGAPVLAPRSPLEAAVLELFRAALPAAAELGVESDFFAAGGSSLGAALLVQRLGAQLGAAVPVVVVFERSTPAAFAAWLASDHPEAATRLAAGTVAPVAELPPSVVALAPGEPGGAPWWFVHPLSGEVFFYRHLVEVLAAQEPGQPIYGFEAPGLRGGEPLATLEALAAVYVAGLEALWPSGEIRLAGSSLGGSIVWEMARQLAARGRRPAVVVLIDAKHPAAGAVEPAAPELSTAALLFSHLGGRPAAVVAGEIAGLSADELLVRLRAEAPSLPASFGVQDLERILAVIGANGRAYGAYRPQPYDGPVRFLRATEDAPAVPFDAAWRPLAMAGLEVVDVPGSHLSMHRSPHVAALAAVLLAGCEKGSED